MGRKGDLMLVVISDLHLIDSTAGRHNIDPEWFENVFLNYIPSLAERKQAQELKVLLMGDIVDLIRTEKWLDTPPPIRPWGEEGWRDIEKTGSELSESETQKRCLEILGDREDLEESGDHDKKTIYARNWRTFKLFKKDFAEKVRAKMDDDFKVELLYLPGNHDRLCNLYPGLRNEPKDTLGLSVDESTVMGDPTGRDWWYHPYFKDESYGVYARHGHEYDIYNYGGANNLTRAGQIQVSIGDVMAPEFAVKVPRLVREYAEGGHYKIPDAESLVARLQEGDNVRPVSSVVEWFYYSIKDRDARDVRRALKDAIRQAVEEMLEIGVVQEWRSPETHADEVVRAAASPWLRWLPSAALSLIDGEDLLSLFGGRSSTRDAFPEAAYGKETTWKQEEDIRYVLYGHTHEPVLHPLEVSNDREVLYINTGTWRNRILKTVPSNPNPQFYLLDQSTYVVFYREDEDPGKQPGAPSFEAWTGSGKKVLA